MRPGEIYWLNHLDGTKAGQQGFGPSAGPGWVVEVVGTFVQGSKGQIDMLGIHGVYEWDDDGSSGQSMNPCWALRPIPVSELDGACR